MCVDGLVKKLGPISYLRHHHGGSVANLQWEARHIGFEYYPFDLFIFQKHLLKSFKISRKLLVCLDLREDMCTKNLEGLPAIDCGR